MDIDFFLTTKKMKEFGSVNIYYFVQGSDSLIFFIVFYMKTKSKSLNVNVLERVVRLTTLPILSLLSIDE